AERLVRRAAGGDPQRLGAVEDGHLDLGAEGELGERHRQVAQEIDAVTREDRVLADPHEDVEVARGAAVDAARPLAGHAQLHAVVDAGGDLHVQKVLAATPAIDCAVAARALFHLPYTVGDATSL